jgi:hypothetical protein
MKCPTCDNELASAYVVCERCGTQPTGTPQLTVTMGPAAGGAEAVSTPAKAGEGTLLAGRYRILGLLGEGGMGAVYKVLDLALDRVVALKTIHGPLARNPRALEFFKNELILARQVTHKNVCRVFDFGQDPDGYFLTMEYVEGQSLGNVIRKSVQAAGHRTRAFGSEGA